MMDNVINDLRYTVEGEKFSKGIRFIFGGLSKRVAEMESKIEKRIVKEDLSADLQGEGFKVTLPTH